MKKLYWDLTTLIKDEKTLDKKIEKINQRLHTLNQEKNKDLNATLLLKLLEEKEQIKEESNKILIYGSLRYYKNVNDNNTLILKTKVEEFNNEVDLKLQWIDEKILKLGKEKVIECLKKLEPLKKHEFYLKNLFRMQEHNIPEEKNKIVKENNNSINKKITDYNSFIQNMKYKEIIINNKKIELTPINYVKYLQSRDKNTRKEAYLSINETYQEKKEAFADILDTIYQYRIENAKIKNYSSVLEQELFEENIDKQVINTLINSVNKNIPLIQKYFKIKTTLLNEKSPHLYDLNVPLDFKTTKKYTLEESIDIIKEALKPLGKEYLKVVDILLDGHIDAEVEENKYQGLIFSWHTYSFLNFKGSYIDIKNLIHELGHIVNYYFSMKKQTYFYEDSTIFIGEIASIVNEILLNHYLLENAKTKEEKIFYLSKEIENYITSVFKQTMYTELEQELYSIKEKKNLSTDILSNRYINVIKKYYGEDIKYDDVESISWAKIGHLYRFCYYPYKYATGLLMASTVVNSIFYDNTLTKEEYINFLSSGSSNYSLELIKLLHIDFSDSKIIDQGFQILQKDIDLLFQLIEKE